ncbi:hypothetical protein CFE70_006729 [Pyrenophora teres f. teres 0-1]
MAVESHTGIKASGENNLQPKNSKLQDPSKYYISQPTMTFWKIQYPPQSGPGSKVGFTNAKAILNQLSDLGVFADTDGILSNWTKEEIEEGGSITEEDAVKKDDGKHVFKKNTAITSGRKQT